MYKMLNYIKHFYKIYLHYLKILIFNLFKNINRFNRFYDALLPHDILIVGVINLVHD